jgi:hypothetical protein
MPVATVKKVKAKSSVTVVKKMRNYNDEPAFKKKSAKATAFLKKNGLPKAKRSKTK